MSIEIQKRPNVNFLQTVPSPYPREIQRFAGFLEMNGFELGPEGIAAFLQSLENETRIDREGKEVGYSASWYNQHVKAVKQAVRYALNHSPELTDSQRWIIEKYLKNLKLKKMMTGVGKAERIPNGDEVRTLIENADRRLGLMIEFLVETGCRISEMISAEAGHARRQPRLTRITVIGKGEKQRDLRFRTGLYDRIRTEFKGKRWLFEHSGRQYNRISVTNRIKQLSERTIGKPVTAHMLRHYRGTVLSEKLGISKASSELGHSDIRTTKRFYDHSGVSDFEFLNTLEIET